MKQSTEQDGIQRVMTCTVEGNVAMKNVFGRLLGLHKIHQMQFIGFDTMKTLPGTRSTSTSSISQHDDTPKNILKALNDLIQESIKSTRWTTIQNVDELKEGNLEATCGDCGVLLY